MQKISKLFGQGEFADEEKTRSINVDDINQVTGYNPMRVGNVDKNPYKKGSIEQYENEVTYSWSGNNIAYNSNTKSDTSTKTQFQYPDKDGNVILLGKNDVKQFTSTYYEYYPNSLTNDESDETVGKVTKGSKAYKALFSIDAHCWLGSQYVQTKEGDVIFGLFKIYKGRVFGCSLCRSNLSSYLAAGAEVRPAVALKPNVTLTGNSTLGWTLNE